MHDQVLEAAAPDVLRAGVRVSVASIVWTTSTSAAAVVLGIAGGSLVLVAFGVTGLLDAAGSATLVAHFRHALHHEAFSERHERLALRVVTTGLVLVGTATLIESGHRLVAGSSAETVPAGVVISATSALVLAGLFARKRTVARGIGSRALLADAWLSSTGAVLAVVAVVGSGLAGRAEWIDPAAAGAVGIGAITVGVRMARG